MKRPESRVARLKKINESSENGLPALTVARCRDLLEDYPQDPTAYMFLGMALTELARFDEAEEALENAIVHCAPARGGRCSRRWATCTRPRAPSRWPSATSAR